MHSNSHPETEERAAKIIPPHDPELIAALKATGLSNSEIGSGVGKSSGFLSLYLAGKYPGNVAGFEVSAREWLRDRTVSIASGVATVETQVSKFMCDRLERVRKERELALVVGPAGIGKSRAIGIYAQDHTLAIIFRVRPWHSGMDGLRADLAPAAGIVKFDRGVNKWEHIVEKTKGSGRLLIVDDAHELSHRALQCCVDYHEQTGNPVALVGLHENFGGHIAKNSLKLKLLKDSRRARRVGAVVEVKSEDPAPLITHLIKQLAPQCNGETAELKKLCLHVADQPGMFGAVEKQLKSAARAIQSNPAKTWVVAFLNAHKKLLRSYDLPHPSAI